MFIIVREVFRYAFSYNLMKASEIILETQLDGT